MCSVVRPSTDPPVYPDYDAQDIQGEKPARKRNKPRVQRAPMQRETFNNFQGEFSVPNMGSKNNCMAFMYRFELTKRICWCLPSHPLEIVSKEM